jgi:hypothetical protein
MPAQPTNALLNPPSGATFAIPLDKVSLVEICESDRFRELDRNEQYLNAAQDMAKMYDWNGQLVSDDAAPMAPGWVVPQAMRKPCARYDLAKVIVSRYNGLLFGVDRFPTLGIAGDKDAEEYVKGLAEATRLPIQALEARRLGGACGAVCGSFQIKDGKPIIEVHNAKHVEILQWRDRVEFRPAAAIKAYKYPKRVFDPATNKLKVVDYFYARVWTETEEIEWDPIPYDIAKEAYWSKQPHRITQHNFGFCPFYWTQNLPCSDDEVGYSDFAGMHDNLDEANRLLSSSVRAVKANGDPTLVLKLDPMHNTGTVQKGHGQAIYSPGGAEYLVLPEGAVVVIDRQLDRIRQATFDMANVVNVDPEKLAGGTLSGRALELMYAPMLAQADIYREQYGERFIKVILRDMLRVARKLLGAKVEIQDEAGRRTPAQYKILLPPRIETKPDGTVEMFERIPGELDEITLNWNPYFPPTWTDIKEATEAAKAANGDKPIISQRTSVAAVQNLYGVASVDEEMKNIAKETEEALARVAKSMAESGPKPGALDGKDPKIPGEPDEEEEDEEEEDVE